LGTINQRKLPGNHSMAKHKQIFRGLNAKTPFLILSIIIIVFFLLPLTTANSTETLPSNKDTTETIKEEIIQVVTREREQSAEEDPLTARQSVKIDNPVLHEITPNRFSFYGSLRMRYRSTDIESLLGDGGTRVGTDGAWQFIPEYWLLGRFEVGFKIFDHLDQIIDPGSQGNGTIVDDIFLRLAYVGVEFPKAFLTYGKNWSTYYQVASFTDRFQGTGGDASGTFNAGTDGGSSGTGRADQVWQTRLQINHPWQIISHLKPFNLNIQYQAGEKIPHSRKQRYDHSFGISAIMERSNNFKTGFALNYAAIKKKDRAKLRTIGLNGDDLALLYGLQWFGEKWYFATVFSYLLNHMATNDGYYFDAWGNEVYGHYQIFDRIWLTGGWNLLQPLHDQKQAGAYKRQYAVVGLRYTFKDFQRMIYANIRHDNSKLSSDSSKDVGNTYTIGVRRDVDW